MFKKYLLLSLILGNTLLCTLLVFPYGEPASDSDYYEYLIGSLIKAEVERQKQADTLINTEEVLEIPIENKIIVKVGTITESTVRQTELLFVENVVIEPQAILEAEVKKKSTMPVSTGNPVPKSEPVIEDKPSAEAVLPESEILVEESGTDPIVQDTEAVTPDADVSEDETVPNNTEQNNSPAAVAEVAVSENDQEETENPEESEAVSENVNTPVASNEGSSGVGSPQFKTFHYTPNNWCISVKLGDITSNYCGATFSALIIKLNNQAYPGWDYDDLAAEVVSHIQVEDMDEFLAAVAKSQAYSEQNDVSNAVASAEEAAQYIGTDPISME